MRDVGYLCMGIVIVHVPGLARPVELAPGDSVTFGRGGGGLEVGIEICRCAGSGIGCHMHLKAQQHVSLLVDWNMRLRDNVAQPLGQERYGCGMLGVQTTVSVKALHLSLVEALVCWGIPICMERTLRFWKPGKGLGGNWVHFCRS